MLVGVPKEIKDNEFRVGMTPAAVAELDPSWAQGHRRNFGRHRLRVAG